MQNKTQLKDILKWSNRILATIGLISIGLATIIQYQMAGAVPTEVLTIIVGGVIAGLTYAHRDPKEVGK